MKIKYKAKKQCFFLNLFTMSIPDDVYYRIMSRSCALNYISTFIITITGSIPLLGEYSSLKVSFAQ